MPDTLTQTDRAGSFDAAAAPWLDAAYNLAVWLCGSTAAAEDLMARAWLRAYRAFHATNPDQVRLWLLAIVHETFRAGPPAALPQASGEEWADGRMERALLSIEPGLRVILVLRELEGLPCQAIAQIIGARPAVVASRLETARARLRAAVEDRPQ